MREWLPTIGLVLLGLAASMWLAACSPMTIDGHEVGERICRGGPFESIDGDMTCVEFTRFAVSQLDDQEPAHAAIRDVEIYRDPVRHMFGGFGQREYVVLRLEDNTARAYYIQCGVGMDKDMCFPAT